MIFLRPLFTFLGFLLLCGHLLAQTPGCTDLLANNFNPAATVNDGSCTYPPDAVMPAASVPLAGSLVETSGLIYWNNRLWSHNDDTDNSLYAVDTLVGLFAQTYPLLGTTNTDWEEISQDSAYVYVGDFGNNATGNRTDLHILRIEKSTLTGPLPIIDTLFFTYDNQVDFTEQSANQTDFDCESFLVTRDSIYLFTKQWLSEKTALYVLPKTPGTHVARLKYELDIQGLVTGATYIADKRLMVLCGYSNILQPFVYLLYDFRGDDFFGGNKRKINVSLPFHQIEGITTSNGLKYYLTNEQYVNLPFVNIGQKLHTFDLTYLLFNYFYELATGLEAYDKVVEGIVYPNPAEDLIQVKLTEANADYELLDAYGRRVLQGHFSGSEDKLSLVGLTSGMYFLRISTEGMHPSVYRVVKK